jgi:ketosteroid isomerase-like protein
VRRILLLVAVGACGGRPLPKLSPLPPVGAVADRIDSAAAAAELRSTILDGYRLLAQGYDNVYLDSVARDDKVVLFDVGPDDVIVGDASKAAALRQLFGGEDYELVSKNLDVRISADGSCAWSHDDLSYRVVRDGRRATIPLRATAVYERRDGRWLKVLDHVSYAVAADEAAARAITATVAFPDASPVGEPGVRLRERVAALVATAPQTPAVADAFLLSFDGRELTGPPAGDFPTVRSLFGAEATVDTAGLRVVASATGSVVWAAALLSVQAKGRSFSARATWLLEIRDGELRPVQTHVSVPVPRATLAEAVFGVTVQPAKAE